MSLESLTTEPANIKYFATEEPEHRECLPFDPERDILADEWRMMESAFQHEREMLSAYSVVSMAAELTLLGRPVHLTDTERAYIGRFIKEKTKASWWRGVFDMARCLAILGEPLPEISSDDWKWIISQGDDCYPDVKTYLILSGQPPADPDATFAWAQERIFHAQPYPQLDFAFLSLLLDKKIVHQETEWSRMHSTLAYKRNNNQWKNFCRQSTGMWMLAAGKLERTSEGIRVIRPQSRPDFSRHLEPLPDLRKFASSLHL